MNNLHAHERKTTICMKQYFVRTNFGTIINIANKYITGNQKHDDYQYQNIYIKMYQKLNQKSPNFTNGYLQQNANITYFKKHEITSVLKT